MYQGNMTQLISIPSLTIRMVIGGLVLGHGLDGEHR